MTADLRCGPVPSRVDLRESQYQSAESAILLLLWSFLLFGQLQSSTSSREAFSKLY
jgi:hypothetical protein